MGRIRNAGRPVRADDPLGRLYLPQVRQLGVDLVALDASGEALAGSRSNERVDARVVVYRIEGCCAITSHRLRVKRDLPFHELGCEGLSVCALSSDSFAMSPVASGGRVRAEGNVAVFAQHGEETDDWLRAGQVHDATSVTFLPAWFDRLGDGARAAASALMDEPGCLCDGDFARTVLSAINSVSPLFGGDVAGGRALRGRMAGVSAATLRWYEERTRAESAAGTLGQRRLVRAARNYVKANLDRPLALDGIARALLTSRTRLCAAFLRETGESLGGYVRRTRMERARELLTVRGLGVAEVARAVGYPRASSFTVAFEREVGCSPTDWRAASGDAS